MSNSGKDGNGDLAARIEHARDKLKPPPKSDIAKKYNSLTLAWRMTLELVVGTAIGGALGYGLDQLTGLQPVFMLLIGLLGFAAGVKTVMATAKEASEALAKDAPPAQSGAPSRNDGEGA